MNSGNYKIIIWLFFFVITAGSCSTSLKYSSDKIVVINSGAKGDGVNDDTKAIQRAIDSGYGELVFTKGIYRLTAPIVIDLSKTGPISIRGNGTSKIIMDGPGSAFRFVGTHMGSADPHSVNDNVWQNERMPLIDGIEIVGNNSESIGIEAIGTMQMIISRVLIRETLHGIKLSQRNRNVIISNCHIYHNKGIGIYLDNVNLHQINISNCHISYNAGGGIVVRHGDVHNIQIGTCDIEYNMEKGGQPASNVLFDMSEGDLLEGAIVGCTIQHEVTVPGSSNIRLIGRHSINRTKVGNITIADNNLSETDDNVHIQYGRGVIITGNTFYMGESHNILIENSDNIIINNNILDRNPHYGKKTTNTRDGIEIIGSQHILLSGNQLNNAKHIEAGIIIRQSQSFNLTNSMILNCDGAGIAIIDSQDGLVSGNIINDHRPEIENPIAINVMGGKRLVITNNFSNGNIEHPTGEIQIMNNFMRTKR